MEDLRTRGGALEWESVRREMKADTRSVKGANSNSFETQAAPVANAKFSGLQAPATITTCSERSRTDEILTALGLSADERARLREHGVVGVSFKQ